MISTSIEIERTSPLILDATSGFGCCTVMRDFVKQSMSFLSTLPVAELPFYYKGERTKRQLRTDTRKVASE